MEKAEILYKRAHVHCSSVSSIQGYFYSVVLSAPAAGVTQTNISDRAETKSGSSDAFKHTVNQWELRSDLYLCSLLGRSLGFTYCCSAALPEQEITHRAYNWLQNPIVLLHGTSTYILTISLFSQTRKSKRLDVIAKKKKKPNNRWIQFCKGKFLHDKCQFCLVGEQIVVYVVVYFF